MNPCNNLLNLSGLSRKQKRFQLLGLWGAVAWDRKFIWARRMAQITNFDRETFLINALELKLSLLECFLYVCIGKLCICNVSMCGVCFLENTPCLQCMALLCNLGVLWKFPNNLFFCRCVSARFKNIYIYITYGPL